MTSTELQNLFAQHEKTPTDFIKWAQTWGFKIYDTEISLHKSGGRKINRFAGLAYKLYFDICAKHPD